MTRSAQLRMRLFASPPLIVTLAVAGGPYPVSAAPSLRVAPPTPGDFRMVPDPRGYPLTTMPPTVDDCRANRPPLGPAPAPSLDGSAARVFIPHQRSFSNSLLLSSYTMTEVDLDSLPAHNLPLSVFPPPTSHLPPDQPPPTSNTAAMAARRSSAASAPGKCLFSPKKHP